MSGWTASPAETDFAELWLHGEDVIKESAMSSGLNCCYVDDAPVPSEEQGKLRAALVELVYLSPVDRDVVTFFATFVRGYVPRDVLECEGF